MIPEEDGERKAAEKAARRQASLQTTFNNTFTGLGQPDADVGSIPDKVKGEMDADEVQ
jgi:hypothetical protein